MSIFRIFRSFYFGVLIGGFITWLYLDTGFSGLLSDLEIIWASIIASFAWWFKIAFEKWQNEKKSIAKLQRIYSRNIDTLVRLTIIERQLLENVLKIKAGSTVKYINHIELLGVPDEELIDSIRNIKLLNVLFKNKISIERHNNVLSIIWAHYGQSFDQARDKDNHTYLTEALMDFDSSLEEFISDGEALENEFVYVQASLYVSGKKICESFFQKLTSMFVYSYTDEEVNRELADLNDTMKQYEWTQ